MTLESNETVELITLSFTVGVYLTIWQLIDCWDGTTEQRCTWACGPIWSHDRALINHDMGAYMHKQDGRRSVELGDTFNVGTHVFASELLAEGPRTI